MQTRVVILLLALGWLVVSLVTARGVNLNRYRRDGGGGGGGGASETSNDGYDLMFVANLDPPGIFVAPADTLNFTLIPGFDNHPVISRPVAIDYDPIDAMVYWTDVQHSTISRAFLDGTGLAVLLKHLYIPDGLSLDLVNRVMYWTDTGSDLIERATMDGLNRSVVLNLTDASIGEVEPRPIVLDTINSHLYWADWGSEPRIERANMNGASRMVLVDTRLQWPNGLALDIPGDRMYWCDAGLDRIESTNLLGQDRQLLADLTVYDIHPFDIWVYMGSVYWTDWRFTKLLKRNQLGQITLVGPASFQKAAGLHIYDDAFTDHSCVDLTPCRQGERCRQFQTNYKCVCKDGLAGASCLLHNPCTVTSCSNGGTCFQSTSTDSGFYCQCPERYSGTNCEIRDPYDLVFVANLEPPGIFVAPADTFNFTLIPGFDNHPRISRPVAIDYDPVYAMVYWTDVSLSTINRAFLDGTGLEVLLTDLHVPDGLSLDLVNRVMYWTDTGSDLIERATLDGLDRSVVLNLANDNLDDVEPRAIIVDPTNRYLYWTDWGAHPKIERSGTDGSSRRVLIDTNLQWPNGLALDLPGDKLYWCDAGADRVEYSDLLGNGRTILVDLASYSIHPFDIAFYNDYIYWTDWAFQTIIRVDAMATTATPHGSQSFGKAGGLHIYKDNLCNTNPCLNGGTCVQSLHSFICICSSDFIGANCEAESPPVARVRLQGGTTDNEGRLEISINGGTWGTVCDNSWGIEEAQVACRMLGFADAVSATSAAFYGQGTGDIYLDDVHCNGSEPSLLKCTYVDRYNHNCGHNEDSGVVCQPSVRLAGGDRPNLGRVELYHEGSWGTVCDDQWDINEADIVCRQLGYYGATATVGVAHFGPGSGDILLDDLECLGWESDLFECPQTSVGNQDCHHGEDAGVICNVNVRLVDGASHNEGRVEVYYNGNWGTVCDDGWSLEDATVVCRQLGLGDAQEATQNARFGPGTEVIFLDDVGCSGTEDTLMECSHLPIGTHNCAHTEDAGVICEAQASIRLSGGDNNREGRVELYYNGVWGTVCDDSWGMDDATVACRQLGFSSAQSAPTGAHFGRGVDPVYLDDVDCTGSESTLMSCVHAGIGQHNCDHGKDAGVVCNSPVRLRLVGGIARNEGRLEVFLDGEWGTVCDDSWGLQDAKVACLQLGFPDALAATAGGSFGSGTGPIHLDDVACVGQERDLGSCQHAGVGVNNCNHGEDAGILCVPTVRLVGGSSSNEGRVEVFSDGAWGTVCDDGWDMNDAGVICRDLGFEEAAEALPLAAFGRGDGLGILLDDVACQGDEESVFTCQHSGLGNHNCGHHEDAGVRCGVAIRLVGGSMPSEGRVEIFANGHWGTVCDDGWDQTDAGVVCRQLGFSGALEAALTARFGQGTGEILLDDVSCTGSESQLVDCSHSGIGMHNCNHGEDAGVVCGGVAENIRLVGGSGPFEGRVEIFHNGRWGTVCDDQWDIVDAAVACRQLGFTGGAERPAVVAEFGAGTGDIWLDDLGCSGDEAMLISCPHANAHNCGHGEDAGVVCVTQTQLRLVGGPTFNQGRVEIMHNGVWGTICDDDWDINDAQVVCHQLGFFEAAAAYQQASYGQGEGPIHLDNVQCRGDEMDVMLCSHNGVGINNCGHTEDAGVSCTVSIRLEGGSSSAEGRVEVFDRGEWGTVCDDSWDLNDARVVCRQLNFPGVQTAWSSAHFGAGSGRILLDDVQCDGSENALGECLHSGFGVHNCGHHEDAGVTCSMNGIRLADGTSDLNGRVEILVNGQWGTVCDDGWDMADARVVCRQLGFEGALQAPTNGLYGTGTGNIYLDDVDCTGRETELISCPHRGVGIHNCGHSEDAGVVCSDGMSIRLAGGQHSNEGRVEILYNEQWGTVCDDSWDDNDARVVCRQLGLSGGVAMQGPAHSWGAGSGRIWLDDVACSGTEASLWDCNHPAAGVHNCAHNEDAGVRCDSSGSNVLWRGDITH